MGMINGFKEFIMRGNVIELAVAVVIGTAFTALVNSIVTGVFNPLIAAIFNAETLAESMDVKLGASTISFGLVLAALIQFLLVAAVVYFAFVMPLNKLKEHQARRRQAGVPLDPAKNPVTDLDLLTEIRDLLAAQNGAVAPSAATDAPAPYPSAGAAASPSSSSSDGPKHTL
jgi:large conductance mechanosensitive channel